MITFSPRSFEVTVGFFPQIAMVRRNGLSLATNLGKHHDLTDIHMSDERWEFRRPTASEGEPRAQIRVLVGEQQISICHRFPTTGLEMFERLCEQTLNSFQESLKPEYLFSTTVELEYIAELPPDSLDALLRGLGLGSQDEPGKIDAFGRPCFCVGMQLRFPPFETEDDEDHDEGAENADDVSSDTLGISASSAEENEFDEQADWQAIVTIVSLPDDPTKVSVEIGGRWIGPVVWSDSPALISERLQIAEKFLRTRVKKFLDHFHSGGEA